MKTFPALLIPLLLLQSCASGPRPTPAGRTLSRLVEQARKPGYATIREIGAGADRYAVTVHHPQVASLLKESYSRAEVDQLWTELGPTIEIALGDRALPRAADRVETGENDPTHYDAIWVRDSLWVYLGLRARGGHDVKARELLLTLADYFASPAQQKRFDAVIADPRILAGPEGRMRAVHIRFDGRSPTFDDVQENGRAQTWNHKQNDALGLFLDLFCRAVIAGDIRNEELSKARVAMIEKFPRYFDAVRFEKMPDAGSWEEIERINTSSISLVTSGLERLAAARRHFPRADRARLARLVDRGYRVIREQLRLGGESPAYPAEDPHFRTADAALLNVIYPAQLARLTRADYERVIEIVQPLIGGIGIKRYLGDSYQSGNFWFLNGNTEDTSASDAFAERGSKFVPDSEAQWFFDSWYSIAVGTLARRYNDADLRASQVKYLNRALAQITGGTKETPVLGGDGKPVPSGALPESYNTVIDPRTGARAFVPSPITPLNWAKAAMRIALETL